MRCFCGRELLAGDEDTALGRGEQRIGYGNFLHADDLSPACVVHDMSEDCWCEPEVIDGVVIHRQVQ